MSQSIIPSTSTPVLKGRKDVRGSKEQQAHPRDEEQQAHPRDKEETSKQNDEENEPELGKDKECETSREKENRDSSLLNYLPEVDRQTSINLSDINIDTNEEADDEDDGVFY